MGATRLFRWVAAAFLAALAPAAAGHALAADPFVSMGDELAVGKNRTGEACRLKLVESRTDLGGYRRYNFYCDGWTQPSGDIRSFGVSKQYTVDKLLTDSAWEKAFSQHLGGCGAVEATTLGSSTTAALRECRRQDGGWRALVVGVIIGRRGYDLETFPTNLPLLEASVELLEGKRPPPRSPRRRARSRPPSSAPRPWWTPATSSPASGMWAPFVLVGDGGAP